MTLGTHIFHSQLGRGCKRSNNVISIYTYTRTSFGQIFLRFDIQRRFDIRQLFFAALAV